MYRGNGLRIMIFSNDHTPAHVHVFVGEGEAKINLFGEDGAPEVVWSIGIKHGPLTRAVEIISNVQGDLLDRWTEIHG